MPGEDDARHKETAELIPFLTRLEPALKVVALELSRFSVYHRHAEEYGSITVPRRPHRHEEGPGFAFSGVLLFLIVGMGGFPDRTGTRQIYWIENPGSSTT